MDWQYAQYIFDIFLGLIGGLGGYILKGLRDQQKANQDAITAIHLEHLPKKMDKVDFEMFTSRVLDKFDALTNEVKKGNETLNSIERDIRKEVGGLDRRVAQIEGMNLRRREDNGHDK